MQSVSFSFELVFGPFDPMLSDNDHFPSVSQMAQGTHLCTMAWSPWASFQLNLGGTGHCQSSERCLFFLSCESRDGQK